MPHTSLRITMSDDLIRVAELIDMFDGKTMREQREYIRNLCIQYNVPMSDLAEYIRIERLHGRY